MSALLSGINAIPEVIGSALFGPNDQCVEALLPAPYDEPMLLGQVMAEVRATADTLQSLGASRWSGFVLRYEGGCVIVRSVDNVLLLVLASPMVNLTMLSVGFNVAALKMARPLGQQGRDGRTDPGAGSGPHAGLGAPAGAVDAALFDGVVKAFARQVGPMAKILIKEELNRLGVTAATLAAGQLDELLLALGRRLSDPAKHQAFVADAQKLLRRA